MKTSLINKIIVVFLILSSIVSFSLILVFQYRIDKLPIENDKNYYEETIYLIILVCLILTIFTFILGRYLLTRVGMPLEKLIDNINKVAKNNFKGEDIEINTNDEIEVLVRAFNEMKYKIALYTSELELQNDRLDTFFNNISSSIIIIDSDYKIQIMNGKGGCFYNDFSDKASNSTCYKVFVDRDSPCEKCPVKLYDSGFESEIIINNEVFKLSASKISQSDSYIIESKKITRQYLQDKTFLQLDKLAQLGQLASVVSHEIKNPLATLKSGLYYIDVLLNDSVPDYIFKNEVKETLVYMTKSLDSAEHIVLSLLSFSRKTHTLNHQIDFGKLIDQILMLYSKKINTQKIKVNKEIYVEQLNTKCNIEVFKVILINLISNSIDAMDNNGVLTIIVKTNKNKDIIIKIIDTGSGIKENMLKKIFNPFFTTKNNSKNAGLGLWIVKEELNKINGEIYFESTLGFGTTVTINIPQKMRGEAYEEKEYINN